MTYVTAWGGIAIRCSRGLRYGDARFV